MSSRRPDKLYHGTGVLQLAEILASDKLMGSVPDDYDDSGIHGLSMSSDEAVARVFADEAKDRDWERRWESPVEDGVVLELDGKRLNEVVGVTQIVWDGSASEREWRTRGDIQGVLAVLRRVELDPASCVWWTEVLRVEGMEEEAAALEAIPIDLIYVEGCPLPIMDDVVTLGDYLINLRKGPDKTIAVSPSMAACSR